uniref:SWIM-type domain-containing protein n=1 Tax=Magallana gigas TaxID=29159 RepID=A0A8W8M6K4_MAGGI
MSPCKLQHDAGDQCGKINPRIDFIWKSKMIRSMSRIVPVKLDIDNDSCSSDIFSYSLNGHCSHIVGLIKSLQGFKLHNFSNVPEQQSCTSIPQQWHVPRGSKIKPVPINHLVVARPTESRKRKPVTCQIDLDQEYVKS